eukprot:TRINITY_DN7172_c0_g3_i3.p3 TRINITY_DN7172_c0_g3~~TRINITY_DN7172_c0_g3_i3.p3  ORF type:complete len:177 (+),score=40.77 TRINITY_DN7172_c0_g3_i3:58-588(+)
MGCCQSRPSTGEGNEFLESQSIDKQIKKEEMKISREIKLLLLGSGESGKSTILKQMKLVYGIGFPREFAVEFRPYVYSNILDCTKALIRGCQTLNIVIKDEQSLTRAQELMEIMTITSDNLTEVLMVSLFPFFLSFILLVLHSSFFSKGFFKELIRLLQTLNVAPYSNHDIEPFSS